MGKENLLCGKKNLNERHNLSSVCKVRGLILCGYYVGLR